LAVISGRSVPLSDVRGVLIRRPWIFPEELTHIAEPDRDYVSAEMSAFMVSWLTELTCPVINRPNPTCLSGPAWREPEWVLLASALNIAVMRQRWEIPRGSADWPSSAQPNATELTVVANHCIDDADGPTAAAAERLARAADITLVGLRFVTEDSGPRFLAANLWPTLENERVIDAVLEQLLVLPGSSD